TPPVLSAVNAVLLQPLPYDQPGQLVRVYQHVVANPTGRNFVTPVHYLAYTQRMAAFGTYDEGGADLGVGGGVERIHTFSVSSGYFDVLRARPALGRGFDAGDDFGAHRLV